MNNDLKMLMASIFGVSENDISEVSNMDTLSQWDSLKHMELISALEEHFKVTFEADQIVEMTSVASISKALGKHGIANL